MKAVTEYKQSIINISN